MKQMLSKVYAICMVLLVWYGAYRMLEAFIVPNPWHVFEYLWRESLGGSLWPHIQASLWRILWSVAGSLFFGASSGLLAGSVPLVDRLLTPIVYLFYPVPRVAFLPVFLLLLGLGELSKVALMIAVAAFYIYIPLRDTVKYLPKSYLQQARQFGFNAWQTLRYIILPCVAPELLTALKLTLGTSMATLFFVENYVTQWGLGYFIMTSWFKSDYIALYAGIVLLSLLGNILFALLGLVQTLSIKWQA
ncbi:ABC transporter permease [Fundicoccus sp. Sow4_F4]|uniref:ABC transporter permease n=1 Tax=Fundicoccus sp. Sow4_F4 TaxID=3438783 RepID=UPI003F93DB4E